MESHAKSTDFIRKIASNGLCNQVSWSVSKRTWNFVFDQTEQILRIEKIKRNKAKTRKRNKVDACNIFNE